MMTRKFLLTPFLGLALILGGCANPGTDAATGTTAQVQTAAPVLQVLAIGSANVLAPGVALPLDQGDLVARLGTGSHLSTASYTIAVVPRGLVVDIGDAVEVSAAGPGGPLTITRVIPRS